MCAIPFSRPQSFSRGTLRRRIILYYRSGAYCDVIKSRRNSPQVIVNALAAHARANHYRLRALELIRRVVNNCEHSARLRINRAEFLQRFQIWESEKACVFENSEISVGAYGTDNLFLITRQQNKLIRLREDLWIIARIQIEKKNFVTTKIARKILYLEKLISRWTFGMS